MSKKHFIQLAAALRASRPTTNKPHFADLTPCESMNLAGWRMTVRSVADVCAQTNPRFDRARFLAACGMEDN